MPLDLSVLSHDESDGDESDLDSCDSWDKHRDSTSNPNRAGADKQDDSLWSRCIVHLDVDCFYCQCEELDGPSDYKERPIAIGQKHIIVTSNYVARREGVKKLQLRTEAKRMCPNLLILEGSDLERYRKHSRCIYDTFRQTLKSIREELSDSSMSSTPLDIPACKGGFDEMFADLTAAVNVLIEKGVESSLVPQAYNYGDPSTAGTAVSITEDQSGATSTASHASSRDQTSLSFNGHVGRSMAQQRTCAKRLTVASILADRLRRAVREQTGFTTTIGISVSPMLAKLTSDLKKPDSLNILYPWRSSSILLPMPLRKVPELGSRTLSALKMCLQQHHGSNPEFWTCRHLLQVPPSAVVASLESMKSGSTSGRQLCDILFKKCRGIDDSLLVDDNGGINKTVSVENSFRRGTIRSREAVADGMRDLFVRLPRLLDERQSCSLCPERAFPTTIRVTIRVVDPNVQKRRPSVTKSKQGEFDGKRLMQTTEVCNRGEQLQIAVVPLLESLLYQSTKSEINVTRINIAVTNFADLVLGSDPSAAAVKLGSRSIAQMFASPSLVESKNKVLQTESAAQKKRKAGVVSVLQVNGSRQRKGGRIDACKPPKREPLASKIDPAVLAELQRSAPHIAEEVRRTYGIQSRANTRTTIDHFFRRKS